MQHCKATQLLPLLLLLSHFSRVWLCVTPRWQPTRLPCPWDSPGKNTGVGCHFLLQCMKVKSEREVAQSCPSLSDPMDHSLPGSSIHGIFQARVLEWGAIAFSGKATLLQYRLMHAWKKKITPKGVSQVLLHLLLSYYWRTKSGWHPATTSWTQNCYPLVSSLTQMDPSDLSLSLWESSCPSLQLAVMRASWCQTQWISLTLKSSALPLSYTSISLILHLRRKAQIYTTDCINVHQTFHFSILWENYTMLPCWTQELPHDLF